MSTRIHAKAAEIVVDEFDISGVTNSVAIDINRPMANVTAYADTDATYIAGKPGFTIGVDGLWSKASPNYDAEMFADLTAENRLVGVYPNQMTAGERGYEAVSDISSSPRTASFNEVIALNVTWQGDTPLVRSWSMHRATAVGATANGVSFQVGALSATQKMSAVLRVFAAPGGAGNNTLDAIIASDSAEDFSGSPATQISFTQLTQSSVALSEALTVDGAESDTWWRVQFTYAGAGSRTFNVAISLGISDI